MKRKREPPVPLLYLVTTKPKHLSSHDEATALGKVLLEGGEGRRMEWKELVALTLWKSSKKNDIDTQSNEQQFKATCLILQIGKNKGRVCKRKLDLSKIDQRTLLQKRSEPYRKVMSVKGIREEAIFKCFWSLVTAQHIQMSIDIDYMGLWVSITLSE